MRVTVGQLRELFKEVGVADLGAFRAARERRWTQVGNYAKGELSASVSSNGELSLMLSGKEVLLTTVEAAAFLDHIRRALDSI